MKKIILAVLGITIVVSSFFPATQIAFAQPDGTGEGTVLLDQQNPTSINGSGFEQAHQLLPSCSLVGNGDGTFEGCMIRMIYYVILYPSAWLAGLAGQVFDYFVAFTLNSDSYRSDFIEKGWRIVRDIANISFIFILLFLAFRLMFGSSGSDIARSVSKIILVALIINFSLFATRVIVDVGNIMGRAFYSRIVVSDGIVASEDGFVPLSVGVISQVNPQKLLSERVFNKKFNSSPEEVVIQNNNLGDVGTDASVGNNIGSGYLILIMLIAAAVNLLIGWTFMSVVLFLLARTVGLWLLMIMSPLSFASVGITFLKGKQADFEFWYKQSLSLSFMVVVFMFFLYLTIMFLSDVFGPMVSSLENENASTLHFIMSVLIPISIVYFLLTIARTQAKAMAGAFGDQITSLTKRALVAGLGGAGLALGATALVGGAALRQTVGAAGKAWAKNANTSTTGGRFRKMAGTWASKNSWDARNIKIPKQVGSTIRSGLSYGTGSMFGAGDFALSNVGRGTQAGGYAQRREAYAKAKTEKAKSFAVDADTTVGASGTYTHEEWVVDPATGKGRMVKTTRNFSGDISVNDARAAKVKAQRDLEAEKAIIHERERYDEKKRELERLENIVKENDEAYKDLLARKNAGDPTVSQNMVDTARDYVDLAKNGGIDPATGATVVGVKGQKAILKNIEAMYVNESNKVAQAEARIVAAGRALNERNAQILNSYADSVETWGAIPNLRFGGNQDAAGNIRNLANREDEKGK